MRISSGDFITVKGIPSFDLNGASFVSLSISELGDLSYPTFKLTINSFSEPLTSFLRASSFDLTVGINNLILPSRCLKTSLVGTDGLKSTFTLEGVSTLGMESVAQNSVRGCSTDALNILPIPVSTCASTDDDQVWIQPNSTYHQYLSYLISHSKSKGDPLFASYTNSKVNVVDPLKSKLAFEVSNFEEGKLQIIDFKYYSVGDPIAQSKYTEVHPTHHLIKDIDNISSGSSRLSTLPTLDNGSTHSDFLVQPHANLAIKASKYNTLLSFIHPGFITFDVLSKFKSTIRDFQSGTFVEAFSGSFLLYGKVISANSTLVSTHLMAYSLKD